MSMLEVRSLHGGYGGADVLNGVDLDVGDGEIVAVVGPNGAGKSTLMKAVFGLVNIRSGSIRFASEEIAALRANEIVRRGLAFVPQERNVFPTLSVEENLEMGAFLLDSGVSERLHRIYEMFPPLKERRRQSAAQLSGGQRQMVAIGRALMLEPRLLLLDEPTAGLSPQFTELIFSKIREINAQGVSVLIVEQNARKALAVSDRGYVLALGRNRFEGPGAALVNNREVAELFLGA
ncbi:ABC transporter ATP-binding protein [Bradyrhizobium icense]|uniref:ABC transporter ATP-binding protein n=1 Tax=Bradyrhizobium icense TaxID=1274631 RepID=A0A1B1UQ56_9BRAD|nr:ABC transporter ATP-binding protein [Bradyrhizobium icense]ANW04919.1 ABC transporter ATP-binding protein [Bradyrhizobium icense]